MTDLGTCHGCGHVLGSTHSRECPVADVDPATGEVTRCTVEAWRRRALAAEAEWQAHSCEDVAAAALDAQADAERELFEARAEVERLRAVLSSVVDAAGGMLGALADPRTRAVSPYEHRCALDRVRAAGRRLSAAVRTALDGSNS